MSDATLQITVNLSAPTSLSYGSPRTFVTGTAIASWTPFRVGIITNYTVSPSLPAGLGINASTGVISGTPTTPAAQASYTVTGSNSAGSVQANAVSP